MLHIYSHTIVNIHRVRQQYTLDPHSKGNRDVRYVLHFLKLKSEHNATQHVSHALALQSKVLQPNLLPEYDNPLNADVLEQLFQFPLGNLVIVIPK